jgi:hypothetical protein
MPCALLGQPLALLGCGDACILLGKEPGGPRQEHGTEAIELAEAGLQAPHLAFPYQKRWETVSSPRAAASAALGGGAFFLVRAAPLLG